MPFSSAQSGLVQVNLYLGLLKGNSKDKGKISSWIIMVQCGVWELSISGLIIGAKRHSGNTGGLLVPYSVYSWPVLCTLKQGTEVQKWLWIPAKLSNASIFPTHESIKPKLPSAPLHVNKVKEERKKSIMCPSKPVWLSSFLFVFGIRKHTCWIM